MAVVARARDVAVQLRRLVDALGQPALGALVEHDDDIADHFQVAQFFRGDIEQHVLAARIVLGQGLREVAAGGRQFALRAAELFQHQVGQPGIGLLHPDRVLQSLVVCKHGVLLVRSTPAYSC
ncbi:hypothetical protein D3C72_1990040 [compost metagenome]